MRDDVEDDLPRLPLTLIVLTSTNGYFSPGPMVVDVTGFDIVLYVGFNVVVVVVVFSNMFVSCPAVFLFSMGAGPSVEEDDTEASGSTVPNGNSEDTRM